MSPSGETFRAAVVQLRSGRDVQANLDAVEVALRRAAADGADLALTPETTTLLELRTKRLFASIEPEEGNSALGRLTDLARELGIWLNIGSMAVQVAADKVANRSYLIAPDGAVAARYDKIHMFDVDLPGGESYRESKNYAAGSAAVVADLPWGRLGLTICYDLRFPALYRALAKAGAEFITVPSAFTVQTGQAHWRTLLRARAIETGSYLLAAAQGGAHEAGRETYGHSLIVSPWGEIVAEAGVDPCILLADIEPAKVAEARAKMPSLQHDRAFSISGSEQPSQIREAS
ncbi:MAG: carbon-nitrogen hydrolase family protein [Methyloligellaceae bacterium]